MLPTKQKSVYLLTKKSKKAFCKKRNFLQLIQFSLKKRTITLFEGICTLYKQNKFYLKNVDKFLFFALCCETTLIK